MSSVVISGDTSGSVVVAAPAVAGTNTLTLQAATATSAVNTLGTAVASTSGTSIDFTGLPSWIKRITVMFDGVSLSGTDSFLIQIGDSGGLENTGYNGGGARFGSASVVAGVFTSGFGFNNVTAATLYSGNLILCNVTGNTWSASGMLGGSATEFCNITGGSKTLSGTLDRVSVTRTGTNTFDAGSINIMYEG